jgi:VWFA-related protein
VVVQDYTSDRELLARSLNAYIPPALTNSPSASPGSAASCAPDKQRSETEASTREVEFFVKEGAEQVRLSLQGLANRLALVPGRKSVYWLTEGFPPRLVRDSAWENTIAALNDANIAVNAVDAGGLSVARHTAATQTMQQIAEGTGGQLYTNRNDLDAAMAEGIDASRAAYTLAFYLSDGERDNKIHNLKVEVDRPGLQLLYRRVYYAADTSPSVSTGRKEDLDLALLSPVNSDGVGITARVDPSSGVPSGTLKILVTRRGRGPRPTRGCNGDSKLARRLLRV